MLADPGPLTLTHTSDGSIVLHLDGVGRKLVHVVECVAIFCSISGYNADNLGAAISAHGTDRDGTQCEFRLTGHLHEAAPAVMRREFGATKAPPGCVVVVDVTTPDGGHVVMRYATPPASPKA